MSEPLQEQPFLTHLIELRDRLLKAVIAVLLVFFVLMVYPGPSVLFDLLAAPIVKALPAHGQLIATGVITPFLIPIKISLFAAFLVALPYVLYQTWAFVAPGLYVHEKKLASPLLVSATLLFFIGIAFCYFLVFGQVFAFIQSFAPESVAAMPDIEAYWGFVLSMFIAFGTAFEVPIVVIVLVKIGMVTVDKLFAFRPYFIVLAFVIAAIATPPDVVSQLALAIPMCILYEIGTRVAQYISTTEKRDEESSKTTP